MGKIEALQDLLTRQAVDGLISWEQQQNAARQFGLGVADVEREILALGLLPARYQRNRQMISTAQQRQLFDSRVVVVGAGGIGGYVLEQLARLGVGQIVTIDDDVFEESNLNRQLLSSPAKLGRVKVDVAVERLVEINPAVNVYPFRTRFERRNAAELLADAACVVDAVDNVATRLDLADSCGELGIPLVHGAIAGWYGHVTTVLPGDKSLQTLYRHWKGGNGVEAVLGNPSFTPALAASLQVGEVCKVLLGQGKLLSGRELAFDVLDMELVEVSL